MTGPTSRVSFDDFVAAHGRGLERYAYALTGQSEAAQDLVQTALLKAFRRWRRVGAVDCPEAYVRRILTNCFLDHRRRRSETEVAAGDLGDDRLPAAARTRAASAAGADIRDPADAIAARDEIVRALAGLSPQQRAVIVLRHFLALDDESIARELGCSPATVRTHASRGLGRMRVALAEPAVGPERTLP